MSRESLTALTRGIHHAASTTNAMLAQQYLYMMEQFFDEKDGKLHAKMVYVQIDDQHWAPVPLVSLVNPKGIALDKMKVAMSVRIEETEAKQATADGDGSQADRLGFHVVVSPRSESDSRRSSDVTDIEMEFSAGEPPEGVMRIIEQFTNLIDPKNFQSHSEPPLQSRPPVSIKTTGAKGPGKRPPQPPEGSTPPAGDTGPGETTDGGGDDSTADRPEG